ncbi:MAG: serine/threonine protein kinase, partial [Anaerolineales bacterium]
MEGLTGKTLGRYRLMEPIGQGGMSTVYQAHDLDRLELVALKVLSPYVAQEPRFKARFDREVILLKELHQPNIVPILNYGEEEGITYIVMPFYSGGTLQRRIENGGLGLGEVGRFMDDISGALEYAHHRGIVHRDIKPSNVLMDQDGRAHLSDFGFAYVGNTSHSLTGSVLIGTPAFMSPEQCRGEEVDPRSDLYSLGAVLYQATTGRLPYDAETPMAVVIKHISEPLARPRYVNPYMPDAIEAVVLQAMEKDLDRRYASIGEMNQAFQHALGESLDPDTGLARPEAIGPAPATQVIEAPRRRGFWLWLSNRRGYVLAAFALVALFLAAWALTGGPAGTDNSVEASIGTPTPSAHLLGTIAALSTENALALGGSAEPGLVETAVAATVSAMGLFDPADGSTATAGPSPTPTRTPSAGASSTPGGSGPPPPPPPGPLPTQTPLPPPTANTGPAPSAPPATSTPVPPTAAPPSSTAPPPPPPTIKPN